MKKFLALMLALVMALSLVACGGSNDANKDANNDANSDSNTAADGDVTFDKTISLVVPYDAGGGVYNAAIIVANAAAEKLGQTINVVCMSGNGGQEGVEYVYDQPSDGYTLLATDYGPLITTSIEEDVIYELSDFTPLVEMTTTIPTFFVKADSPYQTMEDLIAAAKAAPGTISVGHGKFHSVPHLPLMLLEEKAGVTFNEVPTSGGSEAKAFVLGGSVDVGASVPSTIAGEVQEGLLRVLAVASDERVPEFPDAPTLQELGYDVSMPAWDTIFCKSDVPENVRAALETALTEAIQSEAAQTAAKEANITLTGTGSVESQAAYEETIKNLTALLG